VGIGLNNKLGGNKMREIKFRGWQDNKMIYQGANGVYPMKRFFLHLKDNVILMQYIGVKDSKGTRNL